MVNFYADMMALCAETSGVNLLNSHLSFIFPAKNKNQAESYKKLFDKVAGGEPGVVIDNTLFAEDGSQTWNPFQQNIGQNYIVDKVLADMNRIDNMFSQEIGIPSANTDKRERLITPEVNANNIETITRCELWLEELKKSCERTRDMFGIDVNVEWRHSPIQKEVNANEQVRDSLPSGAV